MTSAIARRVSMAGALLVSAALLFSVLAEGGAEVAREHELEAPALFEPTRACPASGELAQRRAEEAELGAHARWERAPYAPGDAALAVFGLAEAVACFRVSGDREARARVERELVAWQRELEGAYLRQRLSLALALRSDDVQAAATHAHALRLTLAKAGPAADPYRAFLNGVERASRAARVEQLREQEEQ